MSSNGSAPVTPGSLASSPVLTAEPEQGRRRRSRTQPASAPAIAPAKTRRRTGVLAAGIALVVVGALGAAYLTQVVGDTVQVVAVAQDVQPGELIERTDLTVRSTPRRRWPATGRSNASASSVPTSWPGSTG